MPFLPLPHWIKQITSENAFLERVDRIAARCQNAVWSRIALTVPGMDPHQAYGYVRARAALVVHREIQIATSGQSPLPVSYQRRLYAAVSERAIRDAMTGLARRRDTRRAA